MPLLNNTGPESNNTFANSRDISIVSLGGSDTLSLVECTPCTRYATVTNEGFTQEMRLVDAAEDPPEKAEFASSMIYFISEQQRERLSNGTPPRTIQHECQDDGRAFFQVIAESDALEDSVEGEKVASWLREFAEDYVGTDEYELYYSGNRSIHLHTDQWVKYEEVGNLKSLAESFNQETDGELDTSIYKGIPQFRLPGAEHEDTGLHKVRIEEDFSRANLVRQAQSGDGTHNNNRGSTHYVATIADREALLPKIRDHLFHPHIKGGSEVDDTWSGKPFSPYALTGGGDYSVCLMTVNSMVERDGKHYVRALVHEALGGDGQFTRHDSYSEVLLSSHDHSKWSYDSGDHVVIIGGRSRKSKLIEVDWDETLLLDTELRESGREATVDLLSRWGYDTGERGLVGGNYGDNSAGTSETAKLKSAIDTGRESPDYDSCLRVACRLLRIEGWQAAWDWLEQTLGEDFDSEDTHRKLETLVNTYGDSFEDVTISSDDITKRV